MRRLGVHTSISGGIHLSLERARELGCTTMQIFSHNPRQWSAGRIPKQEASTFRTLRDRYDINPVFVHTSYLINLASVRSDILEKSVALLIREMERADALGADYIILHTGSASQDSEENARQRAVKALNIVSGYASWHAKLLLENTAGERGDISSSMKDLSEIMHGVRGSLIGGICLDTCHAFSAGYDLQSRDGLEALVKDIEEHVGAGSLKLIHLNDSKKGLHSRVDRHEHIGEGGIGLTGLKMFVSHAAFRPVPLILETPKKSEEDDPRNLKVVRGFLT